MNKIGVSRYFWEIFVNTLQHVDERDRQELRKRVAEQVAILPEGGCWAFTPEFDTPPNGYISEAGLKCLREGSKAFVRPQPDSITSIPIYIGIKKD